ncbi:MAG: glutamate-5-semialdehyde dehydrogenase [Verrucomicrobia bacterium]|nr:MAG: glutamate-5-semialdehyde dehydrogenase [Verrucomicrobiota bacterium]
MTLTEQMTELARQAKAAAHALTRLTTEQKNRCLRAMADAIEQRAAEVQRQNALDLEAGEKAGLSKAMLDRLRLTDARIAGMAKGLREVADLPDPVGRVLDERTRPNGLRLRKVATPIGVIVIIYESRPNVTADAAGLCFKSGNATILRGGKEAIHSNRVIAETLVSAANAAVPEFPDHAIQLVPVTDRAAIPALLALTDYVDLCMPRGGEGLIRAVTECSKVPVIKHYKGICSVYVDREADPEMAVKVSVNSKCQRPGVCNAIETLYVDRAVADRLLPELAEALWKEGVELRADAEAHQRLAPLANGRPLKPATEEDWNTEYLDLILNVRLVDGVGEAIEKINRHGSHHSDAIVTANEQTARRFLNEVDSAAVYWNASTRFTDGGEFGMGAEIGISTDKIGARGPMGLEELTSYKWVVTGTGQLR